MSGGGNHVAKGEMSSKLAAEAVRPDVLKSYEDDSQKAAHLLESALLDLRKVEMALDDLARSGPQTDILVQKLELDVENGKKRITECEKRVRDLK